MQPQFSPAKTALSFIAAAVAVQLAAVAHAQEWTTLKGRIVFDGEIPAATPLEITRDEEVCGKAGLVDESLLVNSQNRGLQNVVVWLMSKKVVPVHSDYAPLAATPVQIDNRDCRFVPRIVKVRTGQTLQAINSDPVAHNVAVYGRRNDPFSIVVPQDRPLEKSFQREELVPLRVDCSIHSWMRAYIVVTEHPYVAITDSDGRFVIKNVPFGDWDFRFWHERPGYIPALKSGDETKTLSRGTWSMSLSGQELDLGELHIPADAEF